MKELCRDVISIKKIIKCIYDFFICSSYEEDKIYLKFNAFLIKEGKLEG